MSIIENAPEECFGRFREIVARLLTDTLDRKCFVKCVVVSSRTIGRLAVWQGDKQVPIRIVATRFNCMPLMFHMVQTLEAKKIESGVNKGRYRLQTNRYSYRIEKANGDNGDEALFRWEYERTDPSLAGPPRHHMHIQHRGARKGELDLDRLHMPSWVTIEEIVRFVVHELGHKPPCGARWSKILAKSEKDFYHKLSGKGCPRASEGLCPHA